MGATFTPELDDVLRKIDDIIVATKDLKTATELSKLKQGLIYAKSRASKMVGEYYRLKTSIRRYNIQLNTHGGDKNK